MPFVIIGLIIICVVIYPRFKKVKQNRKYLHQNEVLIRNQISNYYISLSELTNQYISNSDECAFVSKWKDTYNSIKNLTIPKKHVLFPIVARFIKDYISLNRNVVESNHKFIAEEKVRCKRLLSDIDGKVLDDQQSTVVVTD